MPSVGLAWFLFRSCVGVFFSCVLGFVSWVLVRFIMHSFFLVTPLFNEVMNICSIGIAAGRRRFVGRLDAGTDQAATGCEDRAGDTRRAVGGVAGFSVRQGHVHHDRYAGDTGPARAGVGGADRGERCSCAIRPGYGGSTEAVRGAVKGVG